MFTRLSNFTYGALKIANITAEYIEENVDFIIHMQKYEKKALKFLLGDALWADLLSNVEIVPGQIYYSLKATAVGGKWDWFLNGKTYPKPAESACINDCFRFCNLAEPNPNRSFKGILSKVATINFVNIIECILAEYIYYHWSINNRTFDTGVGEATFDSKSTNATSSKHKRIDANNTFVGFVQHNENCSTACLYQFLHDFKVEFPLVNFTEMPLLNYYDI